MSQILDVLAKAGKDGALEESDKKMIEPVVKSLAVALFAAQSCGMIRFPAESGIDLTIGEIESKLDLIGAAFLQKLIESKPT